MNVLEQLIPLAKAHQKADEYVAGTYWDSESQVGCSVGCTIHDAKKLKLLPAGLDNGDHVALAKATGLPELAWRLADNVFEGLPAAKRAAWTPRFLKAASKAKNLESWPARIMVRLCDRLAKDAIRDDVRESCKVTSSLWQRRADGDEPIAAEWDAAWQQADVARQQADVAWQQAYSARQYAAWQQAYSARQYVARQQFWVWLANVICEEFAA